MARTIRIPRTTAMFVTCLSRILREEFGFKIVEHEHWTFQHVGRWVECGSRGACGNHGISSEQFDRALQEVSQTPESYPGEWDNAVWNSFPFLCYEFKMNAYVGVGRARRAGLGNPVGRSSLDMRVRIKESYWDPAGTLFIIQIWIREEDGTMLSGEFGLLDDGMPYRTGSEPPAQPPRRIAFWRSQEEVEA